MKRILTIDGGGIRGVFSLQVLRKVEGLYRERRARGDLVLADVIDYFAGTSTGAIIATCLSWGMSVDQIEKLYVDHGARMFTRSMWLFRLRAMYRADRVADMLREVFAEADGAPAKLGTDRLRTLLLIVLRNATTGSPWPITNHPAAMYNQPGAECNLDLPLWKLVRGSTAAPLYYSPERIDIGGPPFLFVDGGVTPYNNPALIAVLSATLPCYRLGWPIGRDRLHVMSIGTGAKRSHYVGSKPQKVNLVRQAVQLPSALIGSSEDQQDMICRVLGACVHGDVIDSEVGALSAPSLLPADEQKFTYVRYNRRLDIADGKTMLPPLVKARMDDVRTIPMLQRLGREYAETHVRGEHLEAAEA